MRLQRIIKRIIDITFSALGLIVLAPLMIVIAKFIIIFMGFPVFFRQERIGLKGRPFNIIKFRTMRNAFDSEGNLLPDEQRLTGLGSFLRRSRMDELPELWHVLRGEMSLVGPRPTLREQVENYTRAQYRRLEVRPGLTGWAQVNGGIKLEWPDRIILDVWYIDNWSLWLDFKIILRTIGVVIFGERISTVAEDVMRVPESD